MLEAQLVDDNQVLRQLGRTSGQPDAGPVGVLVATAAVEVAFAVHLGQTVAVLVRTMVEVETVTSIEVMPEVTWVAVTGQRVSVVSVLLTISDCRGIGSGCNLHNSDNGGLGNWRRDSCSGGWG